MFKGLGFILLDLIIPDNTKYFSVTPPLPIESVSVLPAYLRVQFCLHIAQVYHLAGEIHDL